MSETEEAARPAGQSNRFAPGRSGNPRGRPRKQAAGPSAFDVVIDRTLTVNEGGRTRALSIDEALELKTYQAAIAGNAAARREILKMIEARETARAARTPVADTVMVKIVYGAARNADAALRLLEIAGLDPDWPEDAGRMLLAPWAVQAALGRKGARTLTAPELAALRDQTRDPAQVDWPAPAGEADRG